MLDWTRIDASVIASSYPQDDDDLRTLAREGVTLVINLHEKAHGKPTLKRARMRELHLPVEDFCTPTAVQIEAAVSAIASESAAGNTVAVHCAFGIGRTGTVVACWLVSLGLTPEDAIRRVRKLRPGSVEMASQERAVHDYAESIAG